MVIKVLFIVKIEENKERTKNVRVNSLTRFYKKKKKKEICMFFESKNKKVFRKQINYSRRRGTGLR